jgi:mercuric ion transport protein
MADTTLPAQGITSGPAETCAAVVAGGGLTTAFGAAACCALPLLLGSIGLSSTWLAGFALLAGPYQPVLLAIAAVGLGTAGILAVRAHRMRAATCPSGAACRSGRRLRLFTVSAVGLGAVLLALSAAIA